ncbi:ATP synthase subunit gamma, mitochondrial-like [Aphidius gifuensis]|uniref:ATP synthase subunit gamma, mitochondrial-like n=1 Tax=Aphidius gifuensis TaxID=684658 RepID=UPI001CDC9F52|nr:ATP synthase subunit gamma, mitochondrial-like [Aphidius gifuensis]
MSSLKVIKSRIKSVGNTKKISQTMKLVSSAKYSRSQKELIQARKFGVCPKLLFDYTELQPNKSPNSQLFVAITSDRGLCGAINSDKIILVASEVGKKSLTFIDAAPKFPLYDGINDDTIDCWLEFSITTMIYWIIKESSTSEYAARMTSMENATKNASDMIKNLSLEYNRTRQAVITGELIEIISGASALK